MKRPLKKIAGLRVAIVESVQYYIWYVTYPGLSLSPVSVTDISSIDVRIARKGIFANNNSQQQQQQQPSSCIAALQAIDRLTCSVADRDQPHSLPPSNA